MGARWSLDLLPAAARLQQAEAQLEEVRAQERLALGGIAVQVESAYAGAAEAKQRLEAWSHAEKRAKTWVSIIQDAIDLGTRDERALMEPLRYFINAKVNHARALMDYSLALSELAKTTGWDNAAPPE